METAKLSQGKIENSAGVLQRGEKFGRIYLAEGPETGASIAMADPESTVLVSLGLSNLKNLSPLIKRYHPKEVIIAGDNDTLSKNKTLEITHEARKFYENCGFISHIIMPKLLPGMEKTDWNDVHRVQGIQGVKNELGLTKDKTNNWVINTANSISKQEMKFINNVNISPDKSTINVNKISSFEPKNNIDIQQQIKQKNMELEL